MVLGGLLLLWAALWLADRIWPLPLPKDDLARVVLAEDGTPLWRFADANGVWRYPVRTDEVSPYYLDALLTYEDRWFYSHPGVNPMALVASETKPQLELLSPRFHLFYNPDTYHKGYANKYEVHFDYLRTGDRVSEIDWPSLVASDRPIMRAVAEFKANH